MASRPGIVNLLVDCGRGAPKTTERAHLVEQVSRAMAAAGQGGATVDLSLVDDATIHQLNLDYANEDHATDVLSFAQHEGTPLHGDATLLGDIVIAVPYARRQAKAGKRPLVDELVHLAVHGLCHLLGYDHRSAQEERVMFGYEAQLREEAARARSGRGVRVVTAPRPRIASPARRGGVARSSAPDTRARPAKTPR